MFETIVLLFIDMGFALEGLVSISLKIKNLIERISLNGDMTYQWRVVFKPFPQG